MIAEDGVDSHKAGILAGEEIRRTGGGRSLLACIRDLKVMSAASSVSCLCRPGLSKVFVTYEHSRTALFDWMRGRHGM